MQQRTLDAAIAPPVAGLLPASFTLICLTLIYCFLFPTRSYAEDATRFDAISGYAAYSSASNNSGNWSYANYQHIDSPINANTDLGLTLDPRHRVSEIRLSFVFNKKLSVGQHDDAPMMFRLTLRGWKLMDTNLDTGDTDYFQHERVRDRDVRQQWLMLSVSKSF